MLTATVSSRDGRIVHIRGKDNKIYLSIGKGTINTMEVEPIETMEEVFDDVIVEARLIRKGIVLNSDYDKPPVEMLYKVPVLEKSKNVFWKVYFMLTEELGVGGEYINSNIGKLYIDAFNGSVYIGVQAENLKNAEHIIFEHLVKDFNLEKTGFYCDYKDFWVIGYKIPENQIYFAENLSTRINSLSQR